MQLTAAIKAAAEEKFGRLRRILTRFDHSDLVLDVQLARTTHHSHKGKVFRCEGILLLGKKQVFAAIEGEELYETIDHCVSSLKKQIQKIKDQLV